MIVRKRKKCNVCGDESYLFSKGRCKPCSMKSYSGIDKKVVNAVGNTGELDRWFKDRRREMTGRCLHCNQPSCKNSDQYFKHSIAHILPKRIFKSVATHRKNWVELCFWNNSCHTNFDNYTLDIIELNCYGIVIERFIEMYPDIDPKERKNIPDSLLQYIKIEQDLLECSI